MRKTRDELGLPERENTVPRNFTIEFGSMMETPADAELEFKIDLFINEPPKMIEDGSRAADGTAATDAETDAETNTEPAKPTFQMSILLSNRPLPNPTSLLDQADNHSAKSTDTKDKSAKAENDKADEENESDEADATANAGAEDMQYSIFGNWFKAESTVTETPEGLWLDWQLQFNNYSNNYSNNEAVEQQRLFESMNVGGSMLFGPDTLAFDPSVEPTRQAAQLQSLFSSSMNQYFSQGQNSWAFDFLSQQGIDSLIG